MSIGGLLLRAVFVGGLLYAVACSAYILARYAQRAMAGNDEARWIGRHVTALAGAHLLLLAWATVRFLAFYHLLSWPWVVSLGVVIALSDYGLWQLYKYRRWRDRRAAKETA